MKINQFEFDGIKSYDECGLYIEKRPAPTIPQRDYTKTHVPGRSGDVIQDNGCFLNVSRTYKVGCPDLFMKFDKIKKMLAKTGYKKLSDSYDPGFFYYAAVTEATSFEEELLNVGRANIVFDCEPYKYSNSGNTPINVSTNAGLTTALKNNYLFSALPKFKISGDEGTSVTIVVNSKSYNFKFPTGENTVYIDSLSESCSWNFKNLNAGYNSESWPELLPGTNKICVIGASDAVIYPQWRTI